MELGADVGRLIKGKCVILHVDMDAFYASVAVRDRPELRGKPVIVGGTPQGRGVVCAASYEARKFGVHSAMPAARAKKLCPQAVFLPTRMDYYAGISREIRDIFGRFTPLVEPLSLDEAFLDVTGSELLLGPPVEIGRQIKREIFKQLQLVASVGVAPNKFLAKIASDLDKPDGFVVVDPLRVRQFLDPLPVGRLWGVGRQTNKLMERLHIRTIGDLRQRPLKELQDHFGQHGEHLWQLAHGIDDRRVVPDREAKSISHETTFAADIDDRDALRAWLLELTDQVARRLRRHGLRGRTVHLKVRFADFRTITRSQKLGEPTAATEQLSQIACGMLATRIPREREPVRLLGMGVSDIDRSGQAQRHLFDQQEYEQQARLDRASDSIKERFGAAALRRASALEHGAQHRAQPRPHDETD